MGMEKLIQEYLNKKNIFAVIGVSTDPKKYGYQVYEDLRSAGYKVYPVNPNASEVLGDNCYPTLKDLPEIPDVVDIVVKPSVTEGIVVDCYKLGIKRVWMQPGSESEDAINFCKENGIDVLYGVCVMVQRRKLDK